MRRTAVVLICLACLTVAAFVYSAHSTTGYSDRTGLDCQACHINPLGGGGLTRLGQGYLEEVSAEEGYGPPGGVKRFVRLTIGYLHILAGVVWFGTIFYVHIILKPVYAIKGLPKSELVLGWFCIGTIAVTGTLLTIARMTSLEAFYQTDFGILLSAKITLFLVMATSAAIATFVVGPKLRAKKAAASQKDAGVLTPEELSVFDGSDGKKAYVSVDGVVYDVTGSGLWKDGRHMRHLAGSDMSQAIRQAPHGLEKLGVMPVVGRLSEDASRTPPGGARRTFYFMAYMNLALVFIILGIVALWRWW